MAGNKTIRCQWANSGPLMIAYHDREWGVPLHDDKKLFEFLILDAFQAGLSWAIMLNKRENFRKAFDDFDAEKIAAYDRDKIGRLLADTGIIRNRLKIEAAVANARAFLKVQETCGSFDRFIWSFVEGRTIVNRRRRISDIPPRSRESDAMSRDLKGKGFKFVGTTICYAFMQAAGLVNDHLISCFRYRELGGS